MNTRNNIVSGTRTGYLSGYAILILLTEEDWHA